MNERMARAIELILILAILCAVISCRTTTSVSVQISTDVYGNQSVEVERTMDTK